MAEEFEIRLAVATDAKALTIFATETFCDTFSNLYTPNDLKVYLESNYTEQIQLSELIRPDYKTLLVVRNENIVGYSTIRFGSREEQIEGPDPVVEIWRFYISKVYIGKGVAKILMNRMMEVFKEYNTSIVWLGVWENNQRAQKFYQKYGFQEVGYHDFVIGSAVDRDLLFQLNLHQLQ